MSIPRRSLILEILDLIETFIENESDTNPWTRGGNRGIKGLHSDVNIRDHRIHVAMDRGAFDITATPRKASRFDPDAKDYDLTIRSKIPSHIKEIPRSPLRPDTGKTDHYDPSLADLKIVDEGTVIERKIPVLKSHLSSDITPLHNEHGKSRNDVIYREMSNEEHQHFLKTGKIESHGEHNIGEKQKGLTYWTTDHRTAASYANNFAPWQHQATFEHPAWVIAAKHPQAEHIRNVPGTAENEVGVSRPIHKDEIVGKWRGDVCSHTSGISELRRVGYSGNNYRGASGVSPSSSVAWSRVE
jgi:hypothetical protein